MTTDYRALCAELNHWVVELAASHPNLSDSAITWINEVADRAASALAQPEPVVSEVRASVVELQVGVEFLDNEGLVVIASYLRRAIALLQRLSTSTNQEESE
jgi:hypothetical protein